MAYRLEADEAIDTGLRRIARERLDAALERLDGLGGAHPARVETSVHDVRKRNKELRALLRLVRPTLGTKAYKRADRAVRDASRLLSGVRDAQAQLATFQDLQATVDANGRTSALEAVSRVQAERAAASAEAVGAGAAPVLEARRLLAEVRRGAESWSLPDDVETVAAAIGTTQADAARWLGRARKEPDDEHLHEWRKRVKRLWYQVRLLEPTAPSVLGPLVDRLDDLSDALGDEHDLSAFLALLERDPAAFGGDEVVQPVIELTRERQADLRARAFGLGARLLAEDPDALAARLVAYFHVDRAQGREPRAGGIADLAGLDEGDRPARTVERERTFLPTSTPRLSGEGRRIRQGYIAIDGRVAVRVRDRSGAGATLTIKAGAGASRTELEWPLDREQFDALWPLAEGRCVEKVRHEVPVAGLVAEVDLFAGALDGLCLIDVEFDSDEALAAFEPPDWFGVEVTDDPRYANSHLAVYGWEPRFDDVVG